MKNLLLLLCAICTIPNMLSAQSVDAHCWGFEESCTDLAHSFALGCIPNASPSYGTPDTDTPAFGQPAPAIDGGARYAHMYTQYFAGCGTAGQQGEGMFLSFNFQAGHTYRISFLARKAGVPELGVYLTNGLPNQETGNGINGCGDTDIVPPVPSGSQNVMTLSGSAFPSTSWGSFTQTVTPGTSFSQLWFRPRLATPTYGDVFIDNICIQECPSVDFEYELCKVENHTLRITAHAPAGTTGKWVLFNAINCNDGTGNNNIYPDALAWSQEANPVFNVTINNGCYVLEYTVASSVEGCPDIVVRKLINSAYGGITSIGGAFFSKVGCASPTYIARFTPRYTASNATHYWTLYNLTTGQILNYITSGAATLNITALYGMAYRIEHWATLPGPLCYISEVHWATFGCGQGGLVEASGSYPLSETIAIKPIDKQAPSDNIPLKTSLLYPNPASTESVTLRVGNVTDKGYDVALHDLQGHLVQTFNGLTTPEMSIPSQDLAAGLYLIKISYATGEQETLKLVIVK